MFTHGLQLIALAYLMRDTLEGESPFLGALTLIVLLVGCFQVVYGLFSGIAELDAAAATKPPVPPAP